MTMLAEAKPYVEAFAATRATNEPAWLGWRRDAAIKRFGELGFPTRRQESWRFNDLRPLTRNVFAPARDGATAEPAALDLCKLKVPSHRVVLVNGGFSGKLSAIGALPKGVWLASTARTLADRPELLEPALRETDTAGAQPFAALNAALFADGFVLALEPGVTLDNPVEIIHLEQGVQQSFHLRNLIRLGAGSRATLVETYAGSGASWINAVGVIDLAQGAALTHVTVQDESREAIHLGQNRIELAAKSRYESFVLTLGGRLSRHDSVVKLDGEGAHGVLDGAYLLRGEQEATNATFVEHVAPGCTSREYFKGVAQDRAHGVFLGTIAVRPNAQKTDAHMLNKNLLLSRGAAIDSKPELDILADDVKCSHGATVGDLDEAALFYLESRGIPPDEARRMLVEAFAVEAVERVENPDLRAHLAAYLSRWLAGGDGK